MLASGAGSNLQAILDRVHGQEAEVVAVGSDKAGAQALERAEGLGVPTSAFARGDFADREARDVAMASGWSRRAWSSSCWPATCNWSGPAFLGRFPRRVINVHPALLPAFPGLRAIEQALDYGVKVFGVTVHFVDEGVDSGPVILQRALELPDVTDPA